MRRILYAFFALLALTGPVFAQAAGGGAGAGAAGGQSSTTPKGTPGEPASGSNIGTPSPGQSTVGTPTPHRRTHRHHARHRTPSSPVSGSSTTAPSTSSGGTSQQ